MGNVIWKRLIRYVSAEDGATHWGDPILDGQNTDINSLVETPGLQVNVLEGDNPFDAKPNGRQDRVKELLGPLTARDVPAIYCQGLNYRQHILELGFSLPKYPMLFMKSRSAIHDTRQPVPIPPLGQTQCDYEGELVIVIGKECKNVSEEDAIDYVAGYCAGNDVSCRDWQLDGDKAGRPEQWSFSKSFDKYAPLGPCIVSTAVLGDAADLEIQTWVNGEERQHSNTADFVFNVRKLVSFFSQGHTLEKGTVIMTGTPNGVGVGMKPPRFLQHDDNVTVKIGGIGTLANTIKFE